jgi:hypothetical protein
MTGVTREMIGAGHGATLKHGIVLSHEVLTEIYLSMDGLANYAKTSGSPQDAALLRQALEAFEWNMNTDLDNIPACEQWVKMLKTNTTALRERLGEKT